MTPKTQFWRLAATVLAALALAAFSVAQDFPTYKGGNGRAGLNSTPTASSPGQSGLRWADPNVVTTSTTIDNTSVTTGTSTGGNTANTLIDTSQTWVTNEWVDHVVSITSGTGAGQQATVVSNTSNTLTISGSWATTPDNTSIYALDLVGFTGSWLIPQRYEEASGPYLPSPSSFPAYEYAYTVAPTSTSDNTAGATAVATYVFQPSGGTQNFSISIRLPQGPTGDPTETPTPFPYVYQQQYVLVEVDSGGGATFFDSIRVDRAATFVPIGNGGLPTAQLFTYDGVNPIYVKVYNTQPYVDTTDTPGSKVVYADAVRFSPPPPGAFVAAPTVFSWGAGTGQQHAVGARNVSQSTVVDNEVQISQTGVVTSYDYANATPGTVRWTWSPTGVAATGGGSTILLPQNVEVTATFPFGQDTAASGYLGAYYFSGDTTNTSAPDYLYPAVEYAPVIPDGLYDIYVYLSGDGGGESFAHSQVMQVWEGTPGTVTPSEFTINASVASGWVRLGTRSFLMNDAGAADLSVEITNYSADPADATRLAYADAVMFVPRSTGLLGSGSIITATPVNATVNVITTNGGTPTATPVTIVCYDNGQIYCLDANGNGDGTTKVYWSYPSIPDTSNATWTDPNHVAGLDGPNGIATMPNVGGFSSISPLVTVDGSGNGRLYVGAANGRVYCLDTTGRGDMNFTTGLPGTTTRLWSFPNDYPSTTPQFGLSGISGSLSAYVDSTGAGKIYVPTKDGRMYAIDALGTPDSNIGTGTSNGGSGTTTVDWTYPALTSPAIGAITTTPAVDTNPTSATPYIYFGTGLSLSGNGPGEFYALNRDTGAKIWSVSQTTQPLGGGTVIPMQQFLGGPTLIPASELGTANDLVVASNENQYVLAFDATDGSIQWQTNELNSGVNQPLTYTPLLAYDTSGVLASFPIVEVPTEDNRTAWLFAKPTDTNSLGGRLAGGKFHEGTPSSVAVGLNYAFVGDSLGYFYAYTNMADSGGSGGPGGSIVTPNNPLYGIFSTAKLKFITRAAYEDLRNLTPTTTYTNFTDGSIDLGTNGFEYGQTIYVLAYDFPYQVLDSDATTAIPAPIVNFEFGATGAPAAKVGNGSRQISGAPAGFDGYAILSFPVSSVGPNSLAPGSGQVQISILSEYGGGGVAQSFSLDPSTTIAPFTIANPLALVIAPSSPLLPSSIGDTVNASDPDNLINGNGTGSNALLASSIGLVNNGGQGTAYVGVEDRSLMLLLTGGGLQNVRVQRQDMAWAGGSASVTKPMPAAFTDFEDLPVNYPNTSLDYPDIKRGAIQVTSDPSGSPENPLFAGVTLIPPDPIGGADLESNPTQRTMYPTAFEFDVNVPKYQPANLSAFTDAVGNTLDGGYVGEMIVFLDRTGSGVFDMNDPNHGAYRTFNLTGGVPVDERISVATPTVDLGTLPVGAGLTPSGVFGGTSPDSSGFAFAGMFKPFVIRNEGNVNLLNLRLEHGYFDGATPAPLDSILSPTTDALGWLDGGVDMDLRSDIDASLYSLAPLGLSQAVLQKPRVGDHSATEFSANPWRRANPNLGQAVDSPLVTTGGANTATRTPAMVTATIPIGFPTGTYSSVIHVVEDTVNDEYYGLRPDNTEETRSDPSFLLKFTVREGQLTNTYSQFSTPMIDDLVPAGTTPSFLYQNVQPTGLRDPNGNVVVAWASDRGSFVPSPGTPSQATTDSQLRIYVASLQGATPATAPSSAGTSPLRDLNAFTPTASSWFAQQTSVSPYPAPAQEGALFNLAADESLISQTEQFHYPSFPSLGFLNPLDPTLGTTFPAITMAFVGDAQINTPNGRVAESRIMAVPMTVDATGNVAFGIAGGSTDPVSLAVDAQRVKGRPSVVQLADNLSVIFYPSAGAGQSGLDYVTFDPTSDTFGTPAPVAIPGGFDSVTAVSATARTYEGADPTLSGLPIIELTITAKLRGRANTEVFFMRMRADGANLGTAVDVTVPTPEMLNREAEPGIFRTAGISWDLTDITKLKLWYSLPGSSFVNLLDTSLPHLVDPETGIIVWNTNLGKIYLDPAMGSVRFASPPPPRAILMIEYQPKVVRLSQGTQAGYSMPASLYDSRLVGDIGFWARADGSGAQSTDAIRSGRYIALYSRAAAGGGQAARPLMTTFRPGVQLPLPVATNPDGTIVGITVTGNTSFFQVDPAEGNLYFTAADEDRTVNISYTGIDSTGNQVAVAAGQFKVGLLLEKTEAAVPVDKAVNESNVATFLDPFDGDRPNLFWMIWSSTRSGGADLFFQTLSPNYTPQIGEP